MRNQKELENRKRILFQQLEVISLYKSHFIEILGTRGLKDKIDEILDEINFLSKEIIKIKSKNKGDE